MEKIGRSGARSASFMALSFWPRTVVPWRFRPNSMAVWTFLAVYAAGLGDGGARQGREVQRRLRGGFEEVRGSDRIQVELDPDGVVSYWKKDKEVAWSWFVDESRRFEAREAGAGSGQLLLPDWHL